MNATRALILIPALLLTFVASDAVAQGRGRGNGRGNANGPEFCRNGQGHPVYGWQWCADRGWDRAGILNNRRNQDNRRDGQYGNQDPGVYRNGQRGNVAFDRGYTDGYEKGLEDARKNHDFDPTRQGWYKSADRGYNSAYGNKTDYKNMYRDGFRDGYDVGYRDRNSTGIYPGSTYPGSTTGPTGSTARRRWPTP